MPARARHLPLLACALLASGCHLSPLTAPRIEAAIAPTFANLVNVQMSSLGLPPLPAAAFEVKASCRRTAGGTAAGSGEWTCALAWRGPDRRPLRDTFELFVGTDGCYMATASAEGLGGPALIAEDGRSVRNLLSAFEGCFDPT